MHKDHVVIEVHAGDVHIVVGRTVVRNDELFIVESIHQPLEVIHGRMRRVEIE